MNLFQCVWVDAVIFTQACDLKCRDVGGNMIFFVCVRAAIVYTLSNI